jgi:hypothetical protein
LKDTFLARQNSTSRRTAFFVAIIAILQFSFQLSLLLRGLKYAAVSLVIDDTYYYLQTAWNTKQIGLVTFDGLHTTNGVQLLWFVIILVLAFLVKTKTALLFATLAVSFLLNSLCFLFILKIGAALKQPMLTLSMAGLWSLQSLPFRIYTMGMENSLHALVFWCAIWQSLRFLILVRDRVRPNFWALTIVLVLNAWTRLDSALLSAVLYLFCISFLAYSYRQNLKLFLQKYIKVILATSLLAGFALVTQLTLFRLMGDSFLPVSALIKTSGEVRGFSLASLDKFVEILILGMPSILQGRFPDSVLIFLGVFGILLAIRARSILSVLQDELKVFINLWFCLLIGEFLYYVYIAFSGVVYMPYFAWYRSPSFIFWTLTASLVAFYFFERIKLVKIIKFPDTIYKWAPVGLCLVIFSVSIYMFIRSIDFTSRLYTVRYETALWLSENSLPQTIFAAWNAGQLGFYSNRPFINLDGVINNVDYFERVLKGPVSISDYLAENKVEYLVDYTTYGSVPDFPVLRSFPIDDGSGRSMHIWQVSPQVTLTR